MTTLPSVMSGATAFWFEFDPMIEGALLFSRAA